MNACDEYRESISLLAADVLDGNEARRVIAHVQECAACREFYEAMRSTCDGIRAVAQDDADVRASGDLHRRVEQAIAGEPGRHVRTMRPSFRQRVLPWIVSAAAACVLVAFGAVLNRTWQGGPGNGLTGNQLGSRGYVSAAAPAFADDDALPTYNAYREALCVSTEKLDWLLDRHAARYLRLANQQPVPMAGLGFGSYLWKPGEQR